MKDSNRELKWDTRFLLLAKHISTWSKDPSTKVGVVVVDKLNRVVSMGYNGFAVGVLDDDRYNNRDTKYDMIIHGDVNAIIFAPVSVKNCTMYTYPFMPCSRCAAIIIQSRISRVVTLDVQKHPRLNFDLSIQQFLEAGVELITYPKDIING